MNIDIRETENGHLLAELNKGVHDLHYQLRPDIFKPYNQLEMVKAFEHMLSEQEMKAFIAWEEKMPVGYILLKVVQRPETPFQHEMQWVYVDQILVIQEKRRSGIGNQLLNKAKEFARRHDIRVLRLDHWADNKLAGAYFSNTGFQYFRQQMELHLTPIDL